MKRVAALIVRLLLACALGILVSAAFPGGAQAASCAPAATQGTAPADFRTYCWLDFSGYVDTTAQGKNGQNFTFNLPDGTTVTLNLKASGGALTAKAVPSWTGSAFGNSAFMNIPGQPILYQAANGNTNTVVLSNIVVTPPSGGTSQYSIIVGDGESTNNGETMSFTTTANPWTRIATIQNGTSNLYPTVAGEGTTTVSETGVTGTVGSFVWRSDGNPNKITSVFTGNGLQGIIIGMRYASVSVVSQIGSTRYNAADQFTYSLKTSSGTVLATGSTSGTATSGFTVASVPTVAASYPFTVSEVMATGSVGTLANYTTSLTCTNGNASSSTSLPSNLVASSYTFPSLQYGDSVLCTFTNTPLFNSIVGTVYNDANHNGGQDGSEAGPGVSGVYVKLAPVSAGACTSPATQAVQVDPTTGAYTLPNLPQGNYCVILDTNNTLTDITPTVPAGWIGTQNAGGVLQVSVPAGSPVPPPQNFGLFSGSKLAGTVFADTGVGSGTPNNGIKDGTEAGVASVTVNAAAGASTVATAVTAGDGSFTLWVPASVSGTVTVTPTLPAGYLATGGNAGTTAGTYTRPGMSYTPAAGQSYTGVGFGLAPPNTFAPNGAQTAQPGTAVFYAHTFTPGSGGQVTFSIANVATPNVPGWTTVLYRDTNCSASIDTAEPLVSAPIVVIAGQPVCLILKQFVPAGIAFGAQNSATLTANFSYTNASPVLSSTQAVNDVTTGGEPTALSLQKLVSNVTRGGGTSTSVIASPGETLQYTLTAQNNGPSGLTTLVVNDATPAFTTFLSAACPGTLPSGITLCTVTTKPAVGGTGAVQWTFTGSLTGAAQLAVTYQVKLSQ
jgi:uncharacterized repeat protein (TIGR01451 family)